MTPGARGIPGFVCVGCTAPKLRAFLRDPEQSRALLLCLIPALLAALALHEIGHGLTTEHYRREVRNAGIGWYWFGPVAFVDTSDMWTTGRWPRVAVSVAGPYTNLVLASVASLAAWF